MVPSSRSDSRTLSSKKTEEAVNHRPPSRPIRSFVRRNGRLTPGQQHALEHLWQLYGIEEDGGIVDPSQLFGRTAPVTLEIGYGNGESLITMAREQPERDFIGIEVHLPGVGRLLNRIEEHQIPNLRTFNGDAVEIIKKQIPDGSIDRVQLFFPDPWHKKRHHKRRMVTTEWLDMVTAKLCPSGTIHMATDWKHYAEQMLEVLSEYKGLTNRAVDGSYIERPDWRPLTKFELRGERLGHGVWDLLFQKL